MGGRKGIVLAGGAGTRLHPLTQVVSKQLLPVYDKPMIYYPLSVLMLAGIRDILIITTPEDASAFRRLLGEGSQWGVRFSYVEQPSPDGLAQAYLLGEEFLDGDPSVMILGDNIFYGEGLTERLYAANERDGGATVFGYRVHDPSRYGVLGFDDTGQVQSIVEKPQRPASNYAVTGLYFYDERASAFAREVKPSARGELEITALNQMYLEEGALTAEMLGRGFAWLDTGTFETLLQAGEFVRTLQDRQGASIGCLEEIAFNNSWIDIRELRDAAGAHPSNPYCRYLKRLADEAAETLAAQP